MHALLGTVYTPGPADTAIQGVFDNITGFITSVGLPGLFALVGLGIAITLGVKYARKGARTV
jgi:hypothetical protein